MRAWHFVGEGRRLGYGDGTTVAPGYTYTWDGPLVLCRTGLHASVRPLDALKYAPGPIVCRVECGGAVVDGDDKIVCSSREVLWMADAAPVLRHFARLCALDVVHLWDAPEIVVRYLRTGDEAARAAARAAARDAARTAASGAASGAAGGAASAAARDAASGAAWNAASGAAWDAARDAAWAAARTALDAQNRRLGRMLSAAPRETP